MSGAAPLKKNGGYSRRSHSNGYFGVISNSSKLGILKHGLASTPIAIEEEQLASRMGDSLPNGVSGDCLFVVETCPPRLPVGLIALLFA